MPGRLVNEYADVVEHLRVFGHVGFFLTVGGARPLRLLEMFGLDPDLNKGEQ